MKTFFKSVLYLFILAVAGIVGFTTYQFNTFEPQAIARATDTQNLVYFQETYDDCRSRIVSLVQKAKNNFENAVVSSIPVQSSSDKDLTIDYLYIPAQKTYKRLFILTSAVHGVEGYVGSAVQQMFVAELLKKEDMDEMGLLLIHGINPYGFKNKRRFSENNVDLNRNCSTDEGLYSTVNEGYRDLAAFLNPNAPVSLTSFRHFFFQLSAVRRILEYGMPSLRQAVLQGQYEYEKGVYFGGKQLEPMIVSVTDLIRETAGPYEIIFNIDLHTGYGTNGTMHLFPASLNGADKKQKLEWIFSGHRIDWGDADDFYTTTGDFSKYLDQILPGKYYLPMAFEFGTLDTHTTMGSIKALHNVMIENQGVQYGYKTPEDEKEVKSRYLEGYYPSDDAWRSKAMEDARSMLIQAIKKFKEIEI